jgi:hypothetical protein
VRKWIHGGFLLLLLWISLGVAGCFRSTEGTAVPIKSGQYVATKPIGFSRNQKRLYSSFCFYSEGWAYITVVDDYGIDAVGGGGSFAEYKQNGSEIRFSPLPKNGEKADGIFEVESVRVLSETTLLEERTGDRLKYKGPPLKVIKPLSADQANRTRAKNIESAPEVPAPR